MADQHPQDQPPPKPKHGQDWNEVSAQEIEQTISSAAELAYELAGDIGHSPESGKIRELSGLEAVETALDVELKQLDHLVGKTKEQLEGLPAPPAQERTASAAPIPDFMSEFLPEGSATVAPESAASVSVADAETNARASSREGGLVSNEGAPDLGAQERQPAPKLGLVGVGSLGQRETRKASKGNKPKIVQAPVPARRRSLAALLESPLFLICDGTIRLLELVDRPLARLSPTTRRALNVTAIAAFCVCLAMFVLSLLIS